MEGAGSRRVLAGVWAALGLGIEVAWVEWVRAISLFIHSLSSSLCMGFRVSQKADFCLFFSLPFLFSFSFLLQRHTLSLLEFFLPLPFFLLLPPFSAFVGMGMMPMNGGRGGFSNVQGHFNPAFMQGMQAGAAAGAGGSAGGGQFGPDGPRKRFRMEESG